MPLYYKLERFIILLKKKTIDADFEIINPV